MKKSNKPLVLRDPFIGAGFLTSTMFGSPASELFLEDNPYHIGPNAQRQAEKITSQKHWEKTALQLKSSDRKTAKIETAGYEKRDVFEIMDKMAYSVFKAYRVSHGLDFIEVERYLPKGHQSYFDIEDGLYMPNFEQLKAFCNLFRIHPMEYILDFDCALSEGLTRLAIDAYLNPTRYHCGYECHDDLRVALDKWVINDTSFNTIEAVLEQLIEDGDPLDQSKIALLSTLMVNDGNPIFAQYGVTQFIESEKDKIQHKMLTLACDIDDRLLSIKTLSEIANEKGELYFGDHWIEYRDFILSLIARADEGEESINFCRELFVDDLLMHNHDITDSERQELFGLLVTISREWSEYNELDEKGYQYSEQLEDLVEFTEQYDFVFDAFETRQAILTQTNIGQSFGQKNDPSYLKSEWLNMRFKNPALSSLFSPKP